MTTRKIGRPSKLTPAVQKKIVKALAAGATHDLAALYAGISRTSFYEWKAKGEAGDPNFTDFSDAIALAEGKGAVELLETIQTAVKDPKEWRAATWILERRYPDDYGKVRQEITGANGGPIETIIRVVRKPKDTSRPIQQEDADE